MGKVRTSLAFWYNQNVVQIFIKFIFIVIYILHLPALLIAYFNHYLARFVSINIPGAYKIEIITTWFTYLFILLAIVFKKSLPPRKKLFFALFFLAYILLMIIMVEKYIASPLNLTQSIPIFVPMPTN